MNAIKKLLLGFLSFVFVLMCCGCAPHEKTPLVVFAAGSLIIPFDALESAFEASHPDIDVQMDYHGSIQVIRHVTELHEDIDVVAPADYSLIPMLMYTSTIPDTDQAYSDWYIDYATNELVLAYSPESTYADEINADNWYEILARPDVQFGLSDPRFDASGYRTLMAFKLAEMLYGEDDIFENILGNKFTTPIRFYGAGDETLIQVPEVLEPKKNVNLLLRGSSVQLIALLESGDLDYAFEYKSVVQQHGLKMVELPDQVNMGNAEYRALYEKVVVNLDFQRFASVKPQFVGDQIRYGITIPSNAPHSAEAQEFIAFLLSPEGQKIMAENSHPMTEKITTDNYDALPESLKSLISK